MRGEIVCLHRAQAKGSYFIFHVLLFIIFLKINSVPSFPTCLHAHSIINISCSLKSTESAKELNETSDPSWKFRSDHILQTFAKFNGNESRRTDSSATTINSMILSVSTTNRKLIHSLSLSFFSSVVRSRHRRKHDIK